MALTQVAAGLLAGSITSSQITSVAASTLTGTQTIPKATLPTGSVLQVVQTTTNTAVTSTTSASWSGATISGSITPTSSTSKIFVLIMQEIQVWSAGQPYATGMWQLLRDSTVIYPTSISSSNGNVFTYDYGGSGINRYNPMPINWLDSPNTTNSITYTTQIKLGSNGGNFIGANTNSTGTITLMEISA
jgi:hypothetical protein